MKRKCDYSGQHLQVAAQTFESGKTIDLQIETYTKHDYTTFNATHLGGVYQSLAWSDFWFDCTRFVYPQIFGGSKAALTTPLFVFCSCWNGCTSVVGKNRRRLKLASRQNLPAYDHGATDRQRIAICACKKSWKQIQQLSKHTITDCGVFRLTLINLDSGLTYASLSITKSNKQDLMPGCGSIVPKSLFTFTVPCRSLLWC